MTGSQAGIPTACRVVAAVGVNAAVLIPALPVWVPAMPVVIYFVVPEGACSSSTALRDNLTLPWLSMDKTFTSI